jgi:hypothetical protein
MAFYQCFKTSDRTTYCSSTKYRSHDEAAEWIAACLEAHGLQGNDIHGSPWEAQKLPANAQKWPDD